MSKERLLIFSPTSYRSVAVTTEATSVPAGAIGTLANAYVAQHPIADSNGAYIGGFGDSSLSFNACFTTEVAEKSDADLANGEYWVDYITGQVRGRKGSTATTINATYKILR